MFRVLRIAALYVSLGASGTLALAYGRCALRNWGPIRSDPYGGPVAYGAGALSPGGAAWAWCSFSCRGEHRWWCYPVNEADRAALERDGICRANYARGESPAWGGLGDRPFPPESFHPAPIAGGSSEAGPMITVVAFGWPAPCVSERVEYLREVPYSAEELRALGGRVGAATSGWVQDRADSIAYSTPLAAAGVHDGYWPTRIVWSGLLLDVLVMTALIATPRGLMGALRHVRSARRARAGACPWCGYERGAIPAHAACPECGRR